jgi:hypothetical protein
MLLLLLAVTFHEDVQPVLERRCQACHRAGEIGPMPLTTYREVRPWARAIREQVLRGSMPPWFAAAGGPFANDPRLTDAEKRVIAAWVDRGAPAGPARPPREWTPGWQIPPPDLVAEIPRAFPVPAAGAVDYQFFVLPLGSAGDRWVTHAEIRPGERRAVHHVVAYVRERGDPWPGNGRRVTTNDILAVYTPGQPAFAAPAGMAKKIPAGADLVLQIHYTAFGKAVRDRTRIGLKFAAGPPRQRVLTLQLNNAEFRIAPGDRAARVSATGTLPADVTLLSLFPHMHLRGTAFEYEILGGEGRVETLLRVQPYDYFWQLDYRLAAPRLLPAGTRLRATGWYDNSRGNPRNPDPEAEVGYGEQAWEEMMIGFFDVAVDPALDKKALFELRR